MWLQIIYNPQRIDSLRDFWKVITTRRNRRTMFASTRDLFWVQWRAQCLLLFGKWMGVESMSSALWGLRQTIVPLCHIMCVCVLLHTADLCDLVHLGWLNVMIGFDSLFTQPPSSRRRMHICFAVVFLLFFPTVKYETTVLGNGWTDFHETFTKR